MDFGLRVYIAVTSRFVLLGGDGTCLREKQRSLSVALEALQSAEEIIPASHTFLSLLAPVGTGVLPQPGQPASLYISWTCAKRENMNKMP